MTKDTSPTYHLRQYGDVTKAEIDAYVAAAIAQPEQPSQAELIAENATLKECLFHAQEAAKATIKEPLKVHVSAEQYMRHEFGAFRGHFAWREIQSAYVQGRYDEEMRQGPSPYPDGNIAQPVKEGDAKDAGFILKTNIEYAAWCKTYYQADSLDERGMASLHGLWAWQEQELRAAISSQKAT